MRGGDTIEVGQPSARRIGSRLHQFRRDARQALRRARHHRRRQVDRVALILQEILKKKANLRIFLVDPHNEYGHCFGDLAHVINPKNLQLPFWLFNFEEIVDVFFRGRPGVEEETEILSELIPIAKARSPPMRAASASTSARASSGRLHRRHAGALPHFRSRHPHQRPHGQAREPLVVDQVPPPDRAHRDARQRLPLRLHVQQPLSSRT